MIFSDACISLYTPSFSSCAAVVCIYSTQNEPSLFYHFARYFPQKENKKAASFLNLPLISLYCFQVYISFKFIYVWLMFLFMFSSSHHVRFI